MKLPESEASNTRSLIFASVSGAVGVVATLSAEQYQFFNKLQNVLAEGKIISGIGGLRHKEYVWITRDSYYDCVMIIIIIMSSI